MTPTDTCLDMVDCHCSGSAVLRIAVAARRCLQELEGHIAAHGAAAWQGRHHAGELARIPDAWS
ncbi:hypothetical protein E2C01_061761 [Portunus trituberculatus]|uniref:Uncharacterized protein n=1 Tax=Portunus trituberculatus TaxID=210409 RepID=A0A5B7HDA1_PORTR|nr:hypothetical protein [Portunus trituberculatus]